MRFAIPRSTKSNHLLARDYPSPHLAPTFFLTSGALNPPFFPPRAIARRSSGGARLWLGQGPSLVARSSLLGQGGCRGTCEAAFRSVDTGHVVSCAETSWYRWYRRIAT